MADSSDGIPSEEREYESGMVKNESGIVQCGRRNHERFFQIGNC